MDKQVLQEIAKALVVPGKGILAADESDGTIKKRFDSISVESTPENHRLYRQTLFTTKGIEEFISGVIMFDETLRQKAQGKEYGDGVPFPKLLSGLGIVLGIKVDLGAKEMANFPGEKITEGLDGLRERLSEYKNLGCEFTKWRAVITIGEGIPSDTCIESNSEGLARFAALSQEADLVPVVEPEVLMDGEHDIGKCEAITYKTLKTVFIALSRHKVHLSGMLLKPNMVISGKESSNKATPSEIAKATLRVFNEVVPKEVPGVVFLSGGQSPEEATVNLNEINKLDNVPWELSFSYGRALQESVLKTWIGKNENVGVARDAFYHRAKMNSLARFGKYLPEAEKENE